MKKWLKAAGIRAVKTMAQAAIATMGVATVMSEVDWVRVASVAALAGIVSILTSIFTNLPELDTGNSAKTWAASASIRALKTAAQTAASTIGVSVIIQEVDWIAVLSASILAGLLSYLTSIDGLPETTGRDNSGNN